MIKIIKKEKYVLTEEEGKELIGTSMKGNGICSAFYRLFVMNNIGNEIEMMKYTVQTDKGRLTIRYPLKFFKDKIINDSDIIKMAKEEYAKRKIK